MNEEPKLRPRGGHDVPQPRRPEGARVRRGEDPLAELARLIGQEDPFANFEGGARPPSPRAPAGNGGDARGTRRELHESRDRAEPRRPIQTPRPHRDEDIPVRARRDSEIPVEPFRSDRVAVTREPRHDHRPDGGREARFTLPRPRADIAHATTTLPRPQPALARAERDDEEDEPHIERPRETESSHFARRDLARDGPDEQYKRTRVTEYDPEYADEADLPGHGDEIYDEEPRRSRRGLAVVAGVIGLAVVGTAGFFGYRAVFDTGDGQPPTIRADSAPVKVTPPGAAKQAEPPGGKQIYERLGGPPPANERIVPREERPVELNQPSRVVTTPVPPVGAVPQPQPQPQQPAVVPVQPAQASTEPRRVRTVSVRADGTIVADQASRIASRPAPQAPLAVNAYANQPAEEPEPPAQPRQGRAPQAQDGSQQPWSVVEPPRPATRTAARSNTPVEAGGFVVQVNSQKTEAEAQAAWRQMQSRFPTVLGSRQANIRRVDLGDRGVFYRAMLGPFASRDAASEVCQSLKTAGGDCIVQRN
jgi:sporulation related protein